MSTNYFKKISVLSKAEKKGFVLTFTPGVNIIYGENDTGKSSLIKSLYFTLGGDLKLDDSWRKDKIITKVEFVFEGHVYVFLREGKKISIFDVSNEIKLISSSTKMAVTASSISKIFNFNLQLVLKSTGEHSLANPACLYLPFYIDQDLGWQKVLNSFTGLSMYDKWQGSAVQFHSGLRPPAYYDLLGKIKRVSLKLDELSERHSYILFAKNRITEKFGLMHFEVDIDDYQKSLDSFLEKCQELYALECDYRISLLKALEERDSISNEIANIKRWVEDFGDGSSLDALEFESKYHLYDNKMAVLENLTDLYQEKNDMDKKVDLLYSKLNESKKLSLELKSMMADVKKELTIHDIIDSYANKKVKETLDEQLLTLEGEIGQYTVEAREYEKQKKALVDKKRAEEINNYFKGFLRNSQAKLDINNPVIAPLIQYSKITQSKTGSRAPRAIFCYHYSLLNTMSKHSSLPMLPIVIDSPKQQDLDSSETEKVINMCTENLGKLGQVIIGASSLERNMHDFNLIKLDEKFSLLRKDSYDQALNEIEDFLLMSLMEEL